MENCWCGYVADRASKAKTHRRVCTWEHTQESFAGAAMLQTEWAKLKHTSVCAHGNTPTYRHHHSVGVILGSVSSDINPLL